MAGSRSVRTRTSVEPMVWALVPYAIEGEKLTAESYENEVTKSELAAAFHALGYPWVWQPIVHGTIEDIAAQIAASVLRRPTVAFNFCDGLDVDGLPGLMVVRALERAGVPFTGSDSEFYRISTHKLAMKRLFQEHGVETPPWEVVPRTGPAAGMCDRLGTPLIVKPDVSFASCGIALRSKVSTDADIERRRDELRRGDMAGLLVDGEVFAERFLGGEEYTVFVGGYGRSPDALWTLPPARRCFADSIPVAERFLTYDRYWGYYREEEPPADGEVFYRYELVADGLEDELATLAKRAYCAVHGHGYARVDIRRDTINGRLSVLEVNANCGLSGDAETSTGSILQLMGSSFPALLARIIEQTLERQQACTA